MSVSLRIENVILSFPHLWEKHAPPGSQSAPKYSAEFIIASKDTAQACQEAARRAAIEAGKGAQVRYLEIPLKSGSEANVERQKKAKHPRPELEGKWYLRASSATYAPQVVDQRMAPIGPDQRDQLFGGCVVNAYLDFYWFAHPQNPGVYVGLQGVQLVTNVGVERMGAAPPSPEQMFCQVPGGTASPEKMDWFAPPQNPGGLDDILS